MFQKFLNIKRKLGKWFWVLFIALIAVGIFFLIKNKNKPEYLSAKVERGLVREELILTGSVEAEKYAKLSFPTSGKIAAVYVTEGQEVKKGLAIISMDRTVLLAAYQQALNNYRKYEASAQNALDSVKDHTGDETYAQKDTRTTAEVNRDNAYDALKAAKYNLDNATVYAPFNGIISSLPYTSPGVIVSMTDTQVEIVDPKTIYFDVDADQNDVTNIKIGQKVAVVLDSFSDKEFSGTVSFVSFTPRLGETGTNYKVKVVFMEDVFTAVTARIGMTGDAKFILSEKDNVLYVPSEFVGSDTKGKFVRVGKYENKVYITIGLEGEERTEIIKGVSEGDVLYD